MSEIVIIRRTESRSERHSQIIYRKGIDHYYATCNTKDIPKNEAHVWDRKKIHARDYCPEDPGSLTVAPDPTPRGGYVKFPRYEFDRGSRNHGDMRYLKARFCKPDLLFFCLPYLMILYPQYLRSKYFRNILGDGQR